MQTLNQCLERMVVAGVITQEEAVRNSNNPEDLSLKLSGITRGQGYGDEDPATATHSTSGLDDPRWQALKRADLSLDDEPPTQSKTEKKGD
jgi:hypothetical protein